MSDKRNIIYALSEEHKLYGPAGSKINGDTYSVLPAEHQKLFKKRGSGYIEDMIAAQTIRSSMPGRTRGAAPQATFLPEEEVLAELDLELPEEPEEDID